MHMTELRARPRGIAVVHAQSARTTVVYGSLSSMTVVRLGFLRFTVIRIGAPRITVVRTRSTNTTVMHIVQLCTTVMHKDVINITVMNTHAICITVVRTNRAWITVLGAGRERRNGDDRTTIPRTTTRLPLKGKFMYDLVSAKLPTLRTFCDPPPAPITLGAQEAAPASALALPMICDPRGRQATSSSTRRSQYLARARCGRRCAE